VQGPALASLRRSTTGFRPQPGFRLCLQFWPCARARPLLQRPQPLCDEAWAEAFDCRAPNREDRDDGLVFPALSRFEQNTGARHFAGRVYPAVQEWFELLTFRVFERDEVLFLGHRWSSSLAWIDQTVPDSGIIHQIRCDGVLVSVS
jgi:hypothetical protein